MASLQGKRVATVLLRRVLDPGRVLVRGLDKEKERFAVLLSKVQHFLSPEEHVAAWNALASSMRRLAWREFALIVLSREYAKVVLINAVLDASSQGGSATAPVCQYILFGPPAEYQEARQARLRTVAYLARELRPVVQRLLHGARRRVASTRRRWRLVTRTAHRDNAATATAVIDAARKEVEEADKACVLLDTLSAKLFSAMRA